MLGLFIALIIVTLILGAVVWQVLLDAFGYYEEDDDYEDDEYNEDDYEDEDDEDEDDENALDEADMTLRLTHPGAYRDTWLEEQLYELAIWRKNTLAS